MCASPTRSSLTTWIQEPRRADRDGAGRHRALETARRLAQAPFQDPQPGRGWRSAHEASVIIPVRNRVKDGWRCRPLGPSAADYLPLQPDRRGQTRRTEQPTCSAPSPRRTAAWSTTSRLGRTCSLGAAGTKPLCTPAWVRFAVQLDSDDIYTDETTLQNIVDVFHREECAAVVGSYRMTNFKLEEIPPGVIDTGNGRPTMAGTTRSASTARRATRVLHAHPARHPVPERQLWRGLRGDVGGLPRISDRADL